MPFRWSSLYSVLVLALTGYLGPLNVLAAITSGPDDIVTWWVSEFTAGLRTTLNCKSSCIPPCIYTWSLKGRDYYGKTLTWTPDGLDNMVKLRCTALNPESGKSAVSERIVTINNPVFVRTSPQNSLPTLNRPQSLVCQGSSLGLPVVWYKDGQKVALDEGISLMEQNTTLHFDSLLPFNAGFYQCEVTKNTIEKDSAFSVGYPLNFDPSNVNISGPDSVLLGIENTFICSASCTVDVDCIIKLQFRGDSPLGTFFVNRNVIKWTPSKLGTFQIFTCVAENAATGRSVEATKMVEVVGQPVSGSEMVKLGGFFGLTLSLGLLLVFDS